MLPRLKTGSFPLWIGAAATVAVIVSFFLPREKSYEFGDFPARGVYTHHLGTRWYDPNNIEPITDEFTVVNPLDETISLSIGAKSCSCVATDFTDTELLPHETATVKLTITPSPDNDNRHEDITLKTGNGKLPVIALTTFAETIPYYSISFSDNAIYDLRNGEERTVPFTAVVYAPDKKNNDSIAVLCDDDYAVVKDKKRIFRKRADDLYEIVVTGEITVRCDLSKVKPPVVHNTIRLEYSGETRCRKDIVWYPKSACSLSKESLFFNTAGLVPQTIEVETEEPSSITRNVPKDDFLEAAESAEETGRVHSLSVSLLPELLSAGDRKNVDSEIAIYLDESDKPAAVIPVTVYVPERAESE